MILSKEELEQKIEPAIPLLKEYWALLLRWQKSVNLISDKTIKEGWTRHILDSAQLYFLLSNQQDSLMDVGSGGGLPAIVIAILNQTLKGPLTSITLVESDLKKCLFLKECARTLHLNINILRERIERVEQSPKVITARAFAPLNELLNLVQNNVSRETILLLPKGKSVNEEIKNNTIKCEIEKIKNIINSEGCILKIKGVEYV
ncbi:MAG: 16S rRNA (guanine(527)-N(7))-methyltransferase RsmG [Alphaproteobacteria bacterium]|nr:16S rRNA (guanine(527)-N(7))-methyltransferase RsmG [Alphaproteobacteria bacterium]